MLNTTPISADRLSSLYSFPAATGAGHRVVLLQFGGGFHPEDLEQHRIEKLGGVSLKPVITGELGAINAPLTRDRLAAIARDFERPGATFESLRATHKDAFKPFLETLEVTSDIQTVRAFAPGAEIVVLFAQLGPSAGSVIDFALQNHDPTVISTSWGTSEWRRTFIEVRAVERALEKARGRGVTVCCASGDFGSLNDEPEARLFQQAPTGKTRVNWPASCPLALACGGSEFRLSGEASARYDAGSEVAWETDFAGLRRATGGGMSGRYSRPSWQRDLPPPPKNFWTQDGRNFDGRWLPDVAAHAGRTYEVVVGGETVMVDGTSVSAPLWAALLARISEKLGHKVGWINEKIYKANAEQREAAFHDITTGKNVMPDEIRENFEAAVGWDACTGLGSPIGTGLLALLGP